MNKYQYLIIIVGEGGAQFIRYGSLDELFKDNWHSFEYEWKDSKEKIKKLTLGDEWDLDGCSSLYILKPQ